MRAEVPFSHLIFLKILLKEDSLRESKKKEKKQEFSKIRVMAS